MNSGKRRKEELKVKRQARAVQEAADAQLIAMKKREGVVVNVANLAPYNSYDVPEFVMLGYYVPKAFQCQGCDRDQVWTARQQKWWYEVAKGYVYSNAKLCRACRRRERERRNEARRIHRQGIAKKNRESK